MKRNNSFDFLYIDNSKFSDFQINEHIKGVIVGDKISCTAAGLAGLNPPFDEWQQTISTVFDADQAHYLMNINSS